MIGLNTSDKSTDRLDVYLDATTDMFGNPYAFKIFTQQEIKYNFSQWIEGVEEAWIYLYQKDNFTYYDDDGTLKKYEPTKIGGTEISDIKVKNVVFGFGAEVANLPKGGVKVYTNDPTDFRSEEEDEKNKRTLRL
jgi:hypothetical protein